ncbi:MAG: hypothetical protein DMG64_14425 [Acidobacteria bacterium]|nr:MAG: hypothetical protein DMG63_04725 [Acidobacteriota bacterium]PYY01381.1 MAG: hypothetical protein DMG64_14425 [Acidobacteriota bacterium]PYY22794.1 MAG: hypothetical protein DMG62_11525 [Acidobacteriota bacterium]HEU0047519.1 hypothetical protein [Nitrososphaera sp.]
MRSLLRNLIGHRSGIVDAKFKDMSHCKETIGQEYDIPDGQQEIYRKVAEATGIALIKAADEALQV